MKHYDWNKEKNEQLKARHGVCFDEIAPLLRETDDILDVIPNPNKKKYPNQKIFVISINSYAYLVPYVEDDENIFLKTIIPSRKATKKYISNQ